MRFSEALRECATDLLDTEDTVRVEQVVFCTQQRYPDVFAEQTEALVRSAAMKVVKDLLRQFTSDDHKPEQLTLAGLSLPTAIVVGDGEVVRADKATWEQLLIGREFRRKNVEAAQSMLDTYDESLDSLRPAMEGTTLTVAEAVRQLIGRAA